MPDGGGAAVRVGETAEMRVGCADRRVSDQGLKAELAVRWLSAALSALFDGLLALELEDGNDVALEDVTAREAARVDAVGVRLNEHHPGTTWALRWRRHRHLADSLSSRTVRAG